MLLGFAGCAQGTTNGFDVAVPEGWADETDNAETKTQVEYELVLEGPVDEGFASVISILRGPKVGRSTLAEATERSRRAIQKRFGGDPRAVPRRLGGREALQIEYGPAGRRARAVVAVHAGRLYSVTLEATEAQFRREEPVFEDMLASWRWEGS